MRAYHKIQSVYFRDPATKHRTFLIGQWSMPEIGYLAENEWLWTEKIDGTNVRVHWDGEHVSFGGRTEDAQMPAFLLRKLEERFPQAKLHAVFGESEALLFGEGFGAKIQKSGANYLEGQDFILFDVMIGDLYLESNNVADIAHKLEIMTVPLVGRGSLYDAIDLVKSGFRSHIATSDMMAEGLVMRPTVELQTRRGERLITKVKHKDFV